MRVSLVFLTFFFAELVYTLADVSENVSFVSIQRGNIVFPYCWQLTACYRLIASRAFSSDVCEDIIVFFLNFVK